MSRRPNTRNRNWILKIFTVRRTYTDSNTFSEEVTSIQVSEGSLNEMRRLRTAMKVLTDPQLYDGGECHYSISFNQQRADDKKKIRERNRYAKTLWRARLIGFEL